MFKNVVTGDGKELSSILVATDLFPSLTTEDGCINDEWMDTVTDMYHSIVKRDEGVVFFISSRLRDVLTKLMLRLFDGDISNLYQKIKTISPTCDICDVDEENIFIISNHSEEVDQCVNVKEHGAQSNHLIWVITPGSKVK